MTTSSATLAATGEWPWRPCPERAREDERWADLERLRASHPMMDAVIDEVRGRKIRIGDHWLCDFASCNYLGFDLHPEIIQSVERELWRWGTHPSWSRLLGNPRLYVEIEEQLTELLGAPDSLVLPTITIIHTSVIPPSPGRGPCWSTPRRTRRSTKVRPSPAARAPLAPGTRPTTTSTSSRSSARCRPACSASFCIDGVNSMTGNLPDLPAYARICREYDALLYVDDAHGFGVIGESPTPETALWPHGATASSRYFGESYDNVVLVAGFSKSYSSLLAFLALPTWMKNHLEGCRRALPLLGSVTDGLACHGAGRLSRQRGRGRRPA